MANDSPSPANLVVSICGGVAIVADLLGTKPLNVYRWNYPRIRGGRDGLIPSTDQLPLLVSARAAGIDLRPEHFFGLEELPPLGIPANDDHPMTATVDAPVVAANSNLSATKE